jgi:hypothetical protein
MIIVLYNNLSKPSEMNEAFFLLSITEDMPLSLRKLLSKFSENTGDKFLGKDTGEHTIRIVGIQAVKLLFSDIYYTLVCKSEKFSKQETTIRSKNGFCPGMEEKELSLRAACEAMTLFTEAEVTESYEELAMQICQSSEERESESKSSDGLSSDDEASSGDEDYRNSFRK